jgi:AcrR family transcriptional regulator
MESPSAIATVKTRRSPSTLRTALIDAAEIEFATHGFDAASTRSIAERAGAHQPQINYHFSSKERLWQSTVDRLFVELDASLVDEPGTALDRWTIALAIGRFIRFSAERPALNRIINLEASTLTARLDWLIERHLAPRFDLVASAWSALRSDGQGADLTVEEVWEIITSFGALHFANAPMLQRLGHGHVVTVDQHIDRTLSLLALGSSSDEDRRLAD